MPNTEKNISLHPLKFEEAIELLVKVRPPAKTKDKSEDTPKKPKRALKKSK